MRDSVSISAIRWSLTIVVLICLGATLLVSFQGRSNDDRLEKALVTQVAAVAQIKANTHNLCAASNTAADGTNDLVKALIRATTSNTLLTPAEKADRVGAYRRAMVPMIVCAK